MRKEKPLIEIRIAGLSEGTHTFDFTCGVEDFRDEGLSDSVFTGDISVKVSAEKTDHELTVFIRTIARANFTCDICLEPLSRELKGEYRLQYGYEKAAEKRTDSETDYRLIDPNRASIDLTEDVRETLLLSIPMKVTCPDNPECMLYRPEPGNRKPDKRSEAEGAWKESLEKLKDKYR